MVLIIKVAFNYRFLKCVVVAADHQKKVSTVKLATNMALNPKPLIMNISHVWLKNNKYQCIISTLWLVKFSLSRHELQIFHITSQYQDTVLFNL